MPRLRKRSAEQQRRAARQSLLNYRERNGVEDRVRNSQVLSLRRETEEYRQNELRRDRNYRQVRRSNQRSQERMEDRERHADPQQRVFEQGGNTSAHALTRQTYGSQHPQQRELSQYRQPERLRDAHAHSMRRSDPLIRSAEQERNTEQHSQRREILEYRIREQQRDALAHTIRRSDPLIRSAEQERNTEEHSQRREIPEYRIVEQQRDALAHTIRRSDPLIRSAEQERNTEEHSQRREIPEYRIVEQERDALAHIFRRSDPLIRSAEQERNTEEHSQRREIPEYRIVEQQRDALAHTIRRSDPLIRSAEQERNTEEHSQRREIPEYRIEEQERDALAHIIRRSDPLIRSAEQERNTEEHSQRREIPEYRIEEQERDALAHTIRRSVPLIRSSEQERNTEEHSQRREITQLRNLERERDNLAHTLRRSDPVIRANEQRLNTALHRTARTSARIRAEDIHRLQTFRIRVNRINPNNRRNENARQTERNRNIRLLLSPESRTQHLEADARRHENRILEQFSTDIKSGPTEICVCCGGLWFPNQMSQLCRNDFQHMTHVFYLAAMLNTENNIYKFCHTCCRIVKTGKTPTICLSNGLHFPEIPDQLKDLTALEERFVAPRIPFMRIVSLGYNRQCAVRGAVVNVPIHLDKTVNVLPRRFDQTEVIQVHLKRRLEFNHSFMTETIRPQKIIQAARYLVNTDLYKEHNVTISNDWLDNVGQNEEVPFISNLEDQSIVEELVREGFVNTIPEEFNPQETLLENIPVENIPLERICIAPGEGQRPLDMLFDKDSEELSYPSIYCGVKRTCTATVGKIIKSEARRYDRRCARVDKVLYSYKKLELSRIKNSISTCLRKKIEPNRHTAANVLDENYLQNLVQHDEGFHILKGVRSSPAHWEGEKKKVLAMIRQYGLPTFFITLSAAESQWPELLVILTKVVQNRIVSEEEVMNYTTQEKYNLVRTDPITCSRYFDQRIRHLFKHFKTDRGIFGQHKVVKFYWRIEFQQRGSPHVHGIYWMENAPIFNANEPTNFPTIANFIDQYVTTDSTLTEVANYVSYQIHNHSRSCQREIRGQKICRFNIPYPPLLNTEILLPLPDDIESNLMEKHRNNYNKIVNLLNANLSNEDLIRFGSFQNFLEDEKIDMTHEDYILALRSSLKKPRVFLKRSFRDRYINAFNPKILEMQRSNMDIQFILDAYACVSYIVNYINKSNRGVSRLLQEAISEIRSGNFTVKQRLQHIGNKFISASEVSGQEASYNILGMNLSQCSNAEIFINTMVPEKRVRILKSRMDLINLPEDSTNIFQSNLLDHYIQRPDVIDNVCLAKFAAYYTFCKTLRRNTRFNEADDDYQENEDININEIGIPLRLKDNSGYMYKRKNAAIIRFPKFSVDVEKDEYFRNLVMLYLPWRNEQSELLQNNNEQTCITHRDVIEGNRILFEKFKEGELENVIQLIQEELNIQQQEDDIATTQILDDEFRALAVPVIDENINILNINDGNERNNNDDNLDDIRVIRLPPLINTDDLMESVRTLNVQQRKYLHHLLRNVLDKNQFCEFISGGTGVGKSRLIKTIYQSITQRFNTIPGCNPDLIKVLLSAPTGKAAFGIGGATLHSLFSLPINQYSGEIRPLSNDAINSLVAKFIDLKIIIIDEISMVGVRMMGYLDARLKQIFKSTAAFGGMSILVFGDLKQLPPVGDRWVFTINSSNPYGLIAGESLWNLFSFYELIEIMRQRDDRIFAQALNSMAVGEMDQSQITLIKSREVNNINVPAEEIHLFWSNAEAEQYNILRLHQISTTEYSSKSFDLIKSDTLPTEQRNRILNMVSKLKVSETQGLCRDLKLKTTAKYMMTVNINTSDGLVNGAAGVLMEVEINIQTGNPTTLWVLFSDDNVGFETRSKKPHRFEQTWTPVEKCGRTFQYKSNESITIERTQFPLVIAEGITIHKSQGSTYSKVVVHTRSRMSRSALYVACSRATSASGLYIVGNFNPPRPLNNSDPVKKELERLRSEKLLKTQYDFISSDVFNFKLYYQNIQSLNAHYQDILTDPTIVRAHIICLVETWCFPEDNIILTGFSVLSRIDCCNVIQGEERHRNKRGVIVYIKTSSMENAEHLFGGEYTINNKTLQYIVFRFKDIYYILLYKAPNFPVQQLILKLQQAIDQLWTRLGGNTAKVYIVGDFNICRNTEESDVETFLIEKGFFPLIEKTEGTTKQGTHIDWVFSNIDGNENEAKVFPTVHSYHDGIFLAAK